MLAKLVKRLEHEVPRRRKKPKPDFLEAIALLWQEFKRARKDVKLRLATDTMKAESILRTAHRRGYLSACVKEGLLPPEAEELQNYEGAAFFGNYSTTGEATGNRPLLVLGGAFEMDRRRH